MEPDKVQLARFGEGVFRLLVETVEDYAMCAMDTEGRIVSWNVGAARIYGYGEGEVIGEPIAIIFTEDDRRAGVPARELREAAEQGRSEDERWHVRKDGSRLWATGLVIPVREPGGNVIGFGKIMRDRTDLKELQDALHNHAIELERANEEKETFLTTLAHELRNPLNVLTQVAEILRRRNAFDRQQLARMVDRQVQHTRRLVDDITDIVRFGRNKLSLQRAPVDLRDAIKAASEMAQPLAKRRGVALVVSVPEAALRVSGEGTRLVQIFVNLLNNAVKFSAAGSQVSLSLASEGDEAVTRVVDRGAGIPPERLPSIFNLFAQAHPSSEAGLGIGLALTRDLVLLHGGTIQARSEGPGTGSEFIVRLPLLGAGRGAEPERSADSQQDP
ncbi:MAG TPA: PAS domain-containing sensor histidine kinase [Steroidobacteraceae bacterium]|nr:PAS domain-containing sensor histidine kinase [Steroidobacteraceae bacterium]